MNESKLTVHVPGEKLLIGKNIIQLEDLSSGIFNTKSLNDFVKFIGQKDPQEIAVYHDDLFLQAFPAAEKVTFATIPFAKCTLSYSPALVALLQQNNKAADLSGMTIFMRSLKKYLSVNSLGFLDALSDLRIKKIIDIVHTNDRRGNFNLQVKAEKGGSKDYEFPENLEFKIPLFDFVGSSEIEFIFDLGFAWTFEETGPVLSFSLSNFDINAKIKEAIAAAVKDAFLPIEGKVVLYSGTFSVDKKTNDFLFKESSLNL